ncbi:MAG: lytic transglycosylase domain-containing protein [Acidobacteriota bacterium]|nr:lytic transglycosylase domain-containing protein [Acidobacteriota bacterium]
MARRGRSEWKGLLAAVALFAGSAGLEAAVRMVVRADGSTHIYNDHGGEGRVRPRPSVSRPASRDLDAMVAQQAKSQRLDTELVRAVIRVESDFDTAALSHKGAMGLMQLMPETASELAVENPYDPEQNLRGGTRYLRRMLDTFGGRLELALAAYNAGPQAVRRFGGIPPYPETQAYVEKVMRIYRGDPDYRIAGSPHLRPGRKTFLYRDSTGRLRMTTSPPGSP